MSGGVNEAVGGACGGERWCNGVVCLDDGLSSCSIHVEVCVCVCVCVCVRFR